MGQDELWDSVKKAAKSSLERFDNLDKNYIFYLEEMVTPKLLTVFYWILLFAFITKGIGERQGQGWRQRERRCEVAGRYESGRAGERSA